MLWCLFCEASRSTSSFWSNIVKYIYILYIYNVYFYYSEYRSTPSTGVLSIMVENIYWLTT
jgi:hypothetical protein